MGTDEAPASGFDAARYCRRHLAAAHNAHLGLRYVASQDDWIELALPVVDHLLDHDGALADAAVISLLDMAGTLSVWVRASTWWPQATIDLRVDWLREANPVTELLGHARCDLIKDGVAYVTGNARDNESRILARFAATYMITR